MGSAEAREKLPKARTESTIDIVIAGEVHSKPFDSSCALCLSPWLSQIDHQLAQGLPYGTVIEFLGARRARRPKPTEVHRHIEHLALPHQQMRRELEQAARERGADVAGDQSLPVFTDAMDAILRLGYERIASGELTVTGHELIAVMRLKAQLEATASKAVDSQLWQTAFTELVEIAKRHLGAKWSDFVKEVYASEAVAAVSGYQQAAPPAVTQGPVSA
jgi:hypothetical protein